MVREIIIFVSKKFIQKNRINLTTSLPNNWLRSFQRNQDPFYCLMYVPNLFTIRVTYCPQLYMWNPVCLLIGKHLLRQHHDFHTWDEYWFGFSVLYQSISSHIEVRFRSLYHSRHKFDYIVYYDEDSSSTLKMKPSLITLRNILEPDFYRIKKRYPLLLKGGYNEFSSKFPSVCNSSDNISLIAPNSSGIHLSSEDNRRAFDLSKFPTETSIATSSIKSDSSSSSLISLYNRNLSDYVRFNRWFCN